MARVTIIKLFTGLNLAPAQLSGELFRAGHACEVVYFKKFETYRLEKSKEFEVSDYCGTIFGGTGEQFVWNCYKPFNDKEFDLLLKELRNFNPDLIGFSLWSGIIKECAIVTQKIKEHFDVPVIWGGPGPTLEPEACIPHADLLCINEGEETIVELANRIDRGESWEGMDGVWVKTRDGSIHKGKNRPNIPLDKIAIPDWQPDNYVQIAGANFKRGILPTNLGSDYPIMTQRGCPFSCSFCIESRYQEMFGKKDSLRRRNVDVVLEELRWAKDHLDIETILFYDDVFTINPGWLKEFLPRYKQEIGLPFWCYTYPTTHTRETLQMLKDAGCMSITMGVQSGSERILREYYNRPTKIRRVIEAGQEIVDVGITGFFDLITISEFDKEEDLRATFDFLTEFPKELKCQGYGEMIGFPTYSYTRMSEANQKAMQDPNNLATSERLPRSTYDYYHRLYRLTRMDLPVDFIREVGNDPKYRDNPELIDAYLVKERFAKFTASIAPTSNLTSTDERVAIASRTPSAITNPL